MSSSSRHIGAPASITTKNPAYDTDVHTQLLQSMYMPPAAIEAFLRQQEAVERAKRNTRWGRMQMMFNTPQQQTESQKQLVAQQGSTTSSTNTGEIDPLLHPIISQQKRRLAPKRMQFATDRRAIERVGGGGTGLEEDGSDNSSSSNAWDDPSVLLPDEYIHPESTWRCLVRRDPLEMMQEDAGFGDIFSKDGRGMRGGGKKQEEEEEEYDIEALLKETDEFDEIDETMVTSEQQSQSTLSTSEKHPPAQQPQQQHRQTLPRISKPSSSTTRNQQITISSSKRKSTPPEKSLPLPPRPSSNQQIYRIRPAARAEPIQQVFSARSPSSASSSQPQSHPHTPHSAANHLNASSTTPLPPSSSSPLQRPHQRQHAFPPGQGQMFARFIPVPYNNGTAYSVPHSPFMTQTLQTQQSKEQQSQLQHTRPFTSPAVQPIPPPQQQQQQSHHQQSHQQYHEEEKTSDHNLSKSSSQSRLPAAAATSSEHLQQIQQLQHELENMRREKKELIDKVKQMEIDSKENDSQQFNPVVAVTETNSDASSPLSESVNMKTAEKEKKEDEEEREKSSSTTNVVATSSDVTIPESAVKLNTEAEPIAPTAASDVSSTSTTSIPPSVTFSATTTTDTTPNDDRTEALLRAVRRQSYALRQERATLTKEKMQLMNQQMEVRKEKEKAEEMTKVLERQTSSVNASPVIAASSTASSQPPSESLDTQSLSAQLVAFQVEQEQFRQEYQQKLNEREQQFREQEEKIQQEREVFEQERVEWKKIQDTPASQFESRLLELEAIKTTLMEQQELHERKITEFEQEKLKWFEDLQTKRTEQQHELDEQRRDHTEALSKELSAARAAWSIQSQTLHSENMLLWTKERESLLANFEKQCDEQRQTLALDHHFVISKERAELKSAISEFQREKRGFEEMRKKWCELHPQFMLAKERGSGSPASGNSALMMNDANISHVVRHQRLASLAQMKVFEEQNATIAHQALTASSLASLSAAIESGQAALMPSPLASPRDEGPTLEEMRAQGLATLTKYPSVNVPNMS